MNMVKSSIDNKTYFVRNKNNSKDAANLLANVKTNMLILNNYLINNKSKFKEYEPYINLLNERINDVILRESGENNSFTSYSVNKGESIVFCLRSKQTEELYDINLLMYVALHEMAHIACPEYDHTPLFKKIFAFFTKVAIELNIYKYINFDKDNVNYCGLTISNSII